VKINFCGCFGISDSGKRRIFSSFGRPFSVRSIDIEFSLNLEHSSLAQTTRGLKKFTLLENLSLRIHQCIGGKANDENKGIRNFSQILEKMRNLKRFSLDHEENICTGNHGLVYLCEALSTVPSLQSIRINFPSLFQSNEEGIKVIQHLTKNPELKEIDLNFSGCKEITDQELGYVGKFLTEQSALHKISLKFSSCCQITDTGMNVLGESLRKKKYLEYLALDFESCERITDIGFASISESLKNLTSLTDLDLNFNG